MTDEHTIDYASFQTRLVAALRAAWEEVRQQRANETFYMYGIETDSDVISLTPFCNTVEQFAAENGEPEYPIEKWAVDQEAELYGAGRDHTAELQDEVNRFVEIEESDDGYEERKSRLLEIFEKSLGQLDSEGFFGSGSDRHNVMLMVDIGDADDDEWEYMSGAVSRLNPPESSADYLAMLQAAMDEDDEECDDEEFDDDDFDEEWDDGE